MLTAWWLEDAVSRSRAQRGLSILALVCILTQVQPAAVASALAAPAAQSGARAQATRLNGEGEALQRAGDLPAAAEKFAQAAELFRNAGDKIYEGLATHNLGLVLSQMTRFAEAQQALELAVHLARLTGDILGEAESLHALGSVYLRMAQWEKALVTFDIAFTRFGAARNPAGQARVLSSVGSTYLGMGDWARAEEYLNQSLPIRRQMRDRKGEATTLGGLAVVYARTGRAAEALSVLEEELRIERALGDREGIGAALGNMAWLFREAGEHDRALEHFTEALALHRQGYNRRFERWTLENIGTLHEQRGRLEPAMQAYREAIAVAEITRAGARLEEYKTTLTAISTHAHERAVLLAARMKQAELAFDLAERGRARNFLDQVGNSRLDPGKSVDPILARQEQELRRDLSLLEQQIRAEKSRPAATERAEVIQSISAQIAERQRAYDGLLGRIKLTSPEYASLVSVDSLTLPKVQSLLDADTTLVSYYVTKEKTIAWVVSRAAVESFELEISLQELSDTIEEFRAFPTTSGGPPSSLTRLHNWLVKPLRPLLKTPLIGVVPHGPLHYLPFAALTDGKRYLSDDFALFSLPSASSLQFVQAKQKSGAPSVLAFAQARPEGLPVLGFAEQEVRAIAGVFNGQAITGPAATETAFYSAAPRADIVHLAAHGQLNAENPLFSRIVLAPDDKNDGVLEVHEAYRLDLARADLVVLSACQTQLGNQSSGDDLIGLNRAFIYAGAPSVVASLWTVDDESTRILMTAFYNHLKAGQGKATALRQAQMDVRKQLPHPYYWSAFVLTGDAGPASAELRAALTPTPVPTATLVSTPVPQPAVTTTPFAVAAPASEAGTGGFLGGALVVTAGVGMAGWLAYRWARRPGAQGS